MSDDMERRLREAFEAKASQITPGMLDAEREREFARAAAAGPRRRHRALALAGLGTAAAVAAAVTVGVIATDHRAAPRPALAVTTHRTTSPAEKPTATMPQPTERPSTEHTVSTPSAPPSSTATTAPSTAPATPQRTQSAPSTPPPATTTEAPTSETETPPTAAGSEPSPSEVDGNYYLRGTLREAAGVAYLPLPGSTPTYIEDETGRTTRLSTKDCAAILDYWNTQMPSEGWTRSSDTKWVAPSGDAWAFTDGTSGACTIQISAGP